jgi:hypothetical protein
MLLCKINQAGMKKERKTLKCKGYFNRSRVPDKQIEREIGMDEFPYVVDVGHGDPDELMKEYVQI